MPLSGNGLPTISVLAPGVFKIFNMGREWRMAQHQKQAWQPACIQ